MSGWVARSPQLAAVTATGGEAGTWAGERAWVGMAERAARLPNHHLSHAQSRLSRLVPHRKAQARRDAEHAGAVAACLSLQHSS